MAAARSSAIISGPAISAARPCSQTAAQAASNAGSPRARIAAIIPASTSPVPARRQPRRRRRREAEPPVGRRDQRVGPLVDDHRAATLRAASSACSALLPGSSPNSFANSPACGVMIASCPRSRSGSPSCADRVGVDHLGRMRRQRQRQHLRDVAHARPDQDAADARVVDRPRCRSGRSPTGSPSIGSRRADPDIAGAGPRRGGRRQRDRAGHLAGQRMDQPAVIFVPCRDRAAAAAAAPISNHSRCRVDADVGQHHPPALLHRRHQPVRRLERAESDGQVEVRDRRSSAAPLSLSTPLGRSQAIAQPRLTGKAEKLFLDSGFKRRA